ncbi:TRAP transporter small permease subunit [Bordetella pseudohinzii]|uniref:TRAP transporter small permease protein n=2 Tax=Bordetella pseudohinzii TaxID=1331258 RepID=A0A0M7F0B2_9BORD|nr:TRAP transporter small permease subunit [Bordetella pseudohinzii]CUI73928.1 TRAP-type mannitol/chloroaromatic compound transport system%2C small permease component [Bordetella pseudohinzii]
MRFLLQLSRMIDALNVLVGRVVAWLILAMVLISTANAFGRKFFHSGSNAWLEIQWYMFGALFLLASGYCLVRNDHVRVDILAQRLSQRAQVRLEIFGILFFLLPGCTLIMWLSWPMFWESYVSGEMSSNSGGLIRWPAKLLLPVGFTLLIAAALSHLIKCIGFLRGACGDPRQREATADEQALAEEIAARLQESGVPAETTDAAAPAAGKQAKKAD